MLSWLFTPAKTAEDVLKEWQVTLRKQENEFNREIDASNREEKEIIRDIREAAKVDALGGGTRERIYENKSRLRN